MLARVSRRAALHIAQTRAASSKVDHVDGAIKAAASKGLPFKQAKSLDAAAAVLKKLRIDAVAAASKQTGHDDAHHNDHHEYDYEADMASRPLAFGQPVLSSTEILPIHHHHPEHRFDGSFDHRHMHMMSVYEYFSPKGGYHVAPARKFTYKDYLRTVTTWDWASEYASDVKHFGEAKDRDRDTDLDAIGYKLFARQIMGVKNQNDPDFLRPEIAENIAKGQAEIMKQVRDYTEKTVGWHKIDSKEKFSAVEGSKLVTAYAAIGMFGPTGGFHPSKPVGLRAFLAASPYNVLAVAITLGSAGYMVYMLYNEWVHYFANIDDFIAPHLNDHGHGDHGGH